MAKEIKEKTLEELIEEWVLEYGNNYDLGNAVRNYYWKKRLKNE